jgi:hypothetical protein
MARTPQRTLNQDLIVTSGDAITGDDSTGSAGGTLELEGGDAAPASGAGGGGVLIHPGVPDGAGAKGIVNVRNNAGDNDTTPILQLTSQGTNAEDIRIFVGTQDPSGTVSANPGDVYVRHNGTTSTVKVNTGAADANTTWTDLAGGSGALTGLPGTIFENLVFYVDAADRNSFVVGATTVTDLQGNGTGGTLTGTTYDDGGWRFDGATGNLTFTKNSNITNLFSGGGTAMVVARPRGVGESGGILACTVNSSLNLGWRLNVRDLSLNRVGVEFAQTFTGTDAVWRTFDQTSRVDTEPLGAFSGVRPWSIGSASAIAVVYDSGATTNDPTIYINGRAWTTTLGLQETSTPTGTADTDTTNNLTIGNEPGDTRTWNGEILAVLLFDRALSAEEVSQVQNVFASRCGIGAIGRSTDQTTLSGQDVVISAGRATGTDSDAWGGNISIIGGEQSSTGFGDGGSVLVRAGHKRSTGSDKGGDLTLASGEGNLPSQVFIYAGSLTSGNTGSFDSVFIHGMDISSTNTGTPGGVYVRGGNAVSTASNRAGGDINIEGGLGDLTAGGDVFIRSGGQTSGNTTGVTGTITISTQRTALGGMSASGGTDTDTGDITITTTGAGATADITGNITISTGSTAAGSGNNPGDITVTAGSFTVANNAVTAGEITLTAGNGTATAGGGGGSVDIIAGNNTNAGTITTGFAGSVTLTAGNMSGTGGSAVAGSIVLTAGTGTGTVTTGGPILISAGAGTSTASGGSVTLACGATGTGTGGAGSFSGGAGGTTGTGGTMLIAGGAGGSVSGTGGATTVRGGNATAGASNGGAATFSGGAATTSGAGGLVTLNGGLSSTTGNGGAVSIFGAGGGSTSGNGGAINIDGGDANTGTGGLVAITTGTVTVSGTSGAFSVTTGNAAGAGNASGGMTFLTGSTTDGVTGAIAFQTSNATGTNRAAGDITFETGNGTGTQEGGDFAFTSGSGDTTGSGGDFQVLLGSGGSTSGIGGDFVIVAGGSNGSSAGGGFSYTGGAAAGTGTGGAFDVACGGSTSGTGGGITLTTGGGTDINSTGDIRLRTHSGSTAMYWRHKTARVQAVIPSSPSTTDILTIGTLSTNSRQLMIDLYVTGVDTATDTNIRTSKITQTAYRSGGTVTLLTALVDETTSNGSVTFSILLFASGNDILLRLNGTGTGGQTFNFGVNWTTQESGQ